MARAVAATSAWAVAIPAAAILAGWIMASPPLRRGVIGPVDVRPNTAVGLLFAAAGLLLRHRGAGRVFACIPLALGTLTCIEHAFALDLGIDALFVPGSGEPSPLRMPLHVAVALAFAGIAGATAWLERAWLQRVSLGAAAVTAFGGVLSLVASLYGARFLPNRAASPVAFAAAILCVLWALAFAAATSVQGPAAAFLLHDRWGDAARRLSAIGVAVPVLLGGAVLAATDRGMFDSRYGIALMTTASGLITVVTIAHYTSRLRKADAVSREADALYRTIVETSQEGICVIDRSRRFTFVNDRLATMLGYRPDELAGQLTDAFIAPEEREAVHERAAARREGSVPSRGELRLLHRDGSVVHTISSATAIVLRDGSPGSVLATLADITERVTVEQALRASEARFRGLYDSNLIPVAFWNVERRVIDGNEAFRQLFGLTRDQLPGWTWSDGNPPGGQELDDAMIAELRARGRCGPFEKELILPDGSRRFLLVALATIDSGTSVAFMVDVTERAAAQRRLEEAHEILAARVRQLEGDERSDERELSVLAARLAEANEELETFSYSVSHDLRAPLRAIDGFTRELQSSYSGALDATGQNYLQRVRAATQRMSLLIDDLLNLSRLSRKPLRRVTVDVTAVAAEVAQEARERAGRAVAFDVEPGLTASADPHLLRVVLENLIGNAVKFTALREDARVEVFDSGGELAVRDNGAGFDARYVDKIFEPFQRLHGHEFEGTGIGLALVQRILRRHGGSIHAESSPGHGATFHFTFTDPGTPAT